MILAQAAAEPSWVQYGFAGLCGLLITVGIPWLLKHISTTNKEHQETVEKIADEHTVRVEKLIDDHAVERRVHLQNMDRVCLTFEKTMQEERAACERRLDRVVQKQLPAH